jgi:hypothetical protein
LGLDKPIKPYRTYLYRNKVLVITKVTTQDAPKPVSKELWHRLYRNLKLPTNTVRQSTATSQFNRKDPFFISSAKDRTARLTVM